MEDTHWSLTKTRQYCQLSCVLSAITALLDKHLVPADDTFARPELGLHDLYYRIFSLKTHILGTPSWTLSYISRRGIYTSLTTYECFVERNRDSRTLTLVFVGETALMCSPEARRPTVGPGRVRARGSSSIANGTSLYRCRFSCNSAIALVTQSLAGSPALSPVRGAARAPMHVSSRSNPVAPPIASFSDPS